MSKNIPVILMTLVLIVLAYFSFSYHSDLSQANELVKQAKSQIDLLEKKAFEQEQLMKSKEEQSRTYTRQAYELKAKLTNCK